MAKLIDEINSSQDLKKFTVDKLPQIAAEMREEIIDVVSKNGGHLGASLGAVEIALAAHYVFDTPRDKIIWDVGHQAYGHKILTGRRCEFKTLRQKGGISGFPKRGESEYDSFGVGHASTAISAALGMACARDMAGHDYKIAAVVGDGALTGGISFEAINNAGMMKKDLLIILNDNKMSISKNVGALSKYLTMITSGKIYNRMEADVWELLGLIPKVGGKTRKLAKRIKESIKGLIVPGIIFDGLGLKYFGPVDGHNVEFLVQTLRDMKNIKGPILLHALTQKGKGYDFAEKDALCCHGVSSFEKVPGDMKTQNSVPSYTEIFGKTLLDCAREDEKLVAITAAMPDNTGLKEFRNTFPDRLIDVGIAEQHAVTFAAGLAAEGMKPVVVIYSTFLQRSFDQIIHDVALQNLPVKFVLDRSGLVGEDGPTHHGVFDLSYLRMIPNMVVMSPKDENEMRHMIKTLVEYDKGPIALRFPRGAGIGAAMDGDVVVLPIGRSETIRNGNDVVLLGAGSGVMLSMEAAGILEEKYGINARVVNARFIKPLDEEFIKKICKEGLPLLTIEENSLAGGFGSAVGEALRKENSDIRMTSIGIPDKFIEHGSRSEQLREIDLSAAAIAVKAAELVESGKLV